MSNDAKRLEDFGRRTANKIIKESERAITAMFDSSIVLRLLFSNCKLTQKDGFQYITQNREICESNYKFLWPTIAEFHIDGMIEKIIDYIHTMAIAQNCLVTVKFTADCCLSSIDLYHFKAILSKPSGTKAASNANLKMRNRKLLVIYFLVELCHTSPQSNIVKVTYQFSGMNTVNSVDDNMVTYSLFNSLV